MYTHEYRLFTLLSHERTNFHISEPEIAGHRSSGDEWDKVLCTVGEKGRINWTDGIIDNMVFRWQNIPRKVFVKRAFDVIDELRRSVIKRSKDPQWVSSPRQHPFYERKPRFSGVVTTRAPLAFAICIAKAPTAVLPPLTKTVCSGSSLPTWIRAW